LRVAIIGTGNMGSGLARRSVRAGHEVVIGSRDPERAASLGAAVGARGGDYASAAAEGDVVILAVPWWSIDSVLPLLGDLSGKILIDATNPVMDETGALQQLRGSSGAEEIAREAPRARIVKCFNHIVADVIHLDRSMQQRVTAFLCGDDADAKQIVARLAVDLGYDPVDVGALSCARLLEPMAALLLGLTRRGTVPADRAFALVPVGPGS